MRKRAPTAAQRFLTRARQVGADVLSTHLGLALAAVVVYVLVGRYAESIEIHNGLGDDGREYGAWAIDAWTTLRDRTLDSYKIQRVFPPTLVWGIHKLFKVPPTDRATIRAFFILNTALVGVVAASYSRVTRLLGVSERARLFGALSILGSYAILKWSHFVPVLTDLWALGIGALFLQFHLERRGVLLAITTLIASFCWPSALEIGCVLLVCMRFDEIDVAPRRARARLPLFIGIALAGAYVLYGRDLLWTSYYPGNNVAKPEEWFLRGSLAIGALFIFYGVYRLLDDDRLYSPAKWLRVLFRWQTWVALAIFFFVRWFRRWASNGAAGALDMRDFLDCTVYTSASRPGVFLLAHALFFGPIVLVLYLRWSFIARRLRETGPGLSLVGVLAIALSLNSESRRLFLLAPIFLPFVVAEIDELEWSPREWGVLLGLTAFSAKLWLAMDPGLNGLPLDWPAQSLFMTLGPWMSWSSYLWQGTITCALLPYFFVMSRDASTRASLRRDLLPSPPTSSR